MKTIITTTTTRAKSVRLEICSNIFFFSRSVPMVNSEHLVDVTGADVEQVVDLNDFVMLCSIQTSMDISIVKVLNLRLEVQNKRSRS